jgi:hypothetical protein
MVIALLLLFIVAVLLFEINSFAALLKEQPINNVKL